MSDDKLLTKNKAFQEVITKLKNQLMKVFYLKKNKTIAFVIIQEEIEHITPIKMRNIEKFLPDMEQKTIVRPQKENIYAKIRVFDYFGTPVIFFIKIFY